MPRFNLDDYETVEERIRRFYAENPDARIVTDNLTTDADRSVSTWVVRASVFLTAGDQANHLPKATGHAFEIDGGAGANQTAAMENAETSAIGRALANAGYSGNKRASREEMAKVERGVDWIAKASVTNSVQAMRALWAQAKAAGADQKALDEIKDFAEAMSKDEAASK